MAKHHSWLARIDMILHSRAGADRGDGEWARISDVQATHDRSGARSMLTITTRSGAGVRKR